jgi:hypothetical protein
MWIGKLEQRESCVSEVGRCVPQLLPVIFWGWLRWMAALMGPVCGLSFLSPLCSPFPGLSHGMASHGGAFDRRPERCSQQRSRFREQRAQTGAVGIPAWLRAFPGVYCTDGLSGYWVLGFTAAAGGRRTRPWPWMALVVFCVGPYFSAPNRVICSRLWLAVLLAERDGVDSPMDFAEHMDSIRSR